MYWDGPEQGKGSKLPIDREFWEIPRKLRLIFHVKGKGKSCCLSATNHERVFTK